MTDSRTALDQPLGLTVHSLPVPGADVMDDARRTRRGRWTMLMLMLVCVAPVVASYLAYYGIRPEGRRNFGVLIDPQRPMPAGHATRLDGQPLAFDALKGQWLLVSVSPAACDARCEKNLYLQRQLRESLGKEKERLDWVWLIADGARVPDTLAPALSKATVLRVPPAVLSGWLKPADGHALAEHLYVVDPMGNWMLRFPPNLDNAGATSAKRDLERLLRASASWDQPGRP